ncbi:MAG: hypothetical protein Q8M15_16440 [Bacteroidota bacterium]|nr:hypothetical protein [Bacteroidota bacterium]
MKNKNQIKVAILEDSEYFNKLMQKRILNYSEMLTYDLHKEFKIKINSYLTAQDCVHKIEADTHLVFADFFLEDKITAWDLLKDIQEKCPKCKIVIMSQNKNIGHLLNLVDDHTVTFIYKDDDAFVKGYRVLYDIARRI